MPEGGVPPIEKGLVLFRGEPLVAHARRFLAGQVSQVMISANRRVEAYAPYGDVIADAPEVGLEAGPLAGIYSALARIATPWLVVMPVDVLNPPPDLIPRLAHALAGQDGSSAAYATTTRSHPLCMMVHRELAPSLRDYLLAGDRKVMLWLDSVGAAPTPFDQSGQAFANINTLDDLQRAELASAGMTGTA